MANKIRIKQNTSQVYEAEAAAAITPGMLIEIDSTGKWAKHSTDSGPALKAFAEENAENGKKITDDYAAGDQVKGYIARPGDVIYAILEGDSTASIAIGDVVRSAGNGNLEQYSIPSGDSGGATGSNELVGQALEAATGGNRFKVLIW